MRKDNKDIKVTEENEEFDIGDVLDIDPSPGKHTIEDEAIGTDPDEKIASSESGYDIDTYEKDFSYLEPVPYPDQELLDPVVEYPDMVEEPSEPVNEIRFELMFDPEDEKDKFYQKHIRKTYDILHPYEK